MTLRILEMAHSPFCIPIVRAIEACGLEVEREEVPNWDRSAIAEATSGSYYQVPVLVHGEEVIYESGPNSQDVAHYVDEHFADGRLFPDRVSGLQEILLEYLESTLEDLAFKQIDPRYLAELDPVPRTLVIRHKERKFGPGCIARWEIEQPLMQEELERHLQRFEAMLGRSSFVLGDSPVYTDFLLFGILSTYTWKGWNQLPESSPNLIAWFECMRTYSFE